MWHTLFFSLIGLTGTSAVRGFALTTQRVMAMLLKRVHHTKRDWKGLISQVLLPVLFVIAAMGLGSIKSDLQHFPKIVLSPALYHVDEQYSFFRLDSLFNFFKKIRKYGYCRNTDILICFNNLFIYIFAFCRHFYPKWLTLHSRCTFHQSMHSLEIKPWPCLFHILMIYLKEGW